MLLVIVALGVGVVLSGVMLTAREPAVRIGENAADEASSRWGAHAAAAFATAALESSADCVAFASTNAGEMVRTFPIPGGSATVSLTRLDGSPPQPGDRELLMTATATVNGMTSTVQKRTSIAQPVPMETAADLRLGEFALYAETNLSIDEGAVIAHSPLTDEDDTIMPVRIGAAVTSAANFDIRATDTLENVALYLSPGSASALDAELAKSSFSYGERLQYEIPLIRETSPGTMATLPLLATNLPAYAGSVATLTQGNYGSLVGSAGAEVSIGTQGQVTAYKFSSINFSTDSVLRYTGRVMVQVSGAMTITSGAVVEPADADASIEFYVGRNVTIHDTAIGLSRDIARDESRVALALANHARADRVRIGPLNTLSGGSVAPTYRICQNSIALTSIHAPQATVRIEGGSTVIGRVTAGDIQMQGDCAVYYDSRLDSRAGFTVARGPLYKNNAPIPEVTTLFLTANPLLGVETWDATLKTTLDTVWSHSSNVLVTSATPVAIEPVPDDEVEVDDNATPSPRVRGKCAWRLQSVEAEDFED